MATLEIAANNGVSDHCINATAQDVCERLGAAKSPISIVVAEVNALRSGAPGKEGFAGPHTMPEMSRGNN